MDGAASEVDVFVRMPVALSVMLVTML